MSRTIIETINLVKTYDNSRVKTHALRGINMEILKGSFSCIIGPSGHGKSTLLQLIGGLDKPTEGSVFIDGTNISKLSDRELAELRAKKIGFVFQFFNLLQNFTSLENIQIAMMFNKTPPKTQKAKAEKLLALVGLSDKADAKPSELSGGQQQRVSIARALANDPDILLMDEPTGNLDSEAEEEVLKHIFEIHKAGKTVVIVTHNNELAKKAEMLFEIRDGKLMSPLDELSSELRIKRLDRISSKIMDWNTIFSQVRTWKAEGKTIAVANGCFDIFHKGHASLVQAASQCADKLIMAVNTDETIRKLKGEGRPVNKELDRAYVLASLESVDAVVLFEQDTPEELLRNILPDVLVKGSEYTIEQIPGRQYATRVELVDFIDGYSTTAIVNKSKE